MVSTHDPLKQQLIDSDENFKSLFQEHQKFEQRLEELRDKELLSEEDELEEKQLKRRKLAVKDQMEAVLRSHRQSHVSV